VSVRFRQGFLEQADGAETHYTVWGDAPNAVVLCDGLACEGYIWKHLRPVLTQHFTVVHWSYRGHGASPPPPDLQRVGLAEIGDDLSTLLEHLQLPSAALLGHSMGVQVALEFHRRFPKQVWALGLLCGAYGKPLDTFHDSHALRLAFPFIREAVERFPALAASVASWATRQDLLLKLSLWLETQYPLIGPDDVAPYVRHLGAMDVRVFVRTLDSLSRHTAESHLPHVDVPTLVVTGEKDTFTPAELSHHIADTIPHAQRLSLPEGTHTAPLEEPEAVERAVVPFLLQAAARCDLGASRV
jgi:pimeloyl-ACP methyl ester carboxylesterase